LGIAGSLGIPIVSGVARTISGLIPGGAMKSRMAARQAGPGGIQLPGIAAFGVAGRGLMAPGQPGFLPRRRRMNPGNVKALRRAMRRQDSFVKLARRALRGSKYKITTVGSGSRRRPLNITESGPGGVTVGR